MQQPGQMGGITGIGFDPVTGRADQLRRCSHRTGDSDEVNVYRTDPNRKDTDRDGRDDGTEVKNGTNPRVPII